MSIYFFIMALLMVAMTVWFGANTKEFKRKGERIARVIPLCLICAFMLLFSGTGVYESARVGTVYCLSNSTNHKGMFETWEGSAWDMTEQAGDMYERGEACILSSTDLDDSEMPDYLYKCDECGLVLTEEQASVHTEECEHKCTYAAYDDYAYYCTECGLTGNYDSIEDHAIETAHKFAPCKDQSAVLADNN